MEGNYASDSSEILAKGFKGSAVGAGRGRPDIVLYKKKKKKPPKTKNPSSLLDPEIRYHIF